MDVLHDEDQLPNLPPLSGEFVGVTQREFELEGNKLLLALVKVFVLHHFRDSN